MFKRKKYNFKTEEDLNRVNILLDEVRRGIADKKRTLKNVSKETKKALKKGLPALGILAVAGLAFAATYKEIRKLSKAVLVFFIVILLTAGAYIFGTKRNSNILQEEIVKRNELIKAQDVMIAEKNDIIMKQQEQINKDRKIIRHLAKKEKEGSNERLDYRNEMIDTIGIVSDKLTADIELAAA